MLPVKISPNFRYLYKHYHIYMNSAVKVKIRKELIERTWDFYIEPLLIEDLFSEEYLR